MDDTHSSARSQEGSPRCGTTGEGLLTSELTCGARRGLREDGAFFPSTSAPRTPLPHVRKFSDGVSEEKVRLLLLPVAARCEGPEPSAGCRTQPPASCISGISCPCTPRAPSTALSAPLGEFTVAPRNYFTELTVIKYTRLL